MFLLLVSVAYADPDLISYQGVLNKVEKRLEKGWILSLKGSFQKGRNKIIQKNVRRD